MNLPPIFIAGSSNTDLVLRVPRVPKPGETLLGGKFLTAAGGKGANQAVAAARAGGAVTFAARLGVDYYGDAALAGFERDGIATQHVKRDRRAPSGVAMILVSEKGENCIAVADSANGQLSPADIRRAAPALRTSAIALAQLEIPLETVQAVADLAAADGVPFILNPAPARKLPAALLRKVSILTPNETECEILTGLRITDLSTAEKAAGRLLAAGVTTAIITMGSRGAFVASAAGSCLVPGFKVKPVDTTAAGDVFNGSLAVALAEGKNLFEAVRFAHAAAALSVQKEGAQTSAPKRRAIEKFLRQQGS